MLDEYKFAVQFQFSKEPEPESYVDMKQRNVGSLGSWLIAKRTLIVLNHTRVLRAIFGALSHMTQRICSPRAVWLVHRLDSVLMLSSVGENVRLRIFHIDSSFWCPCVCSVVMSWVPGFWLQRPGCQYTLGCLTRYQYRTHRGQTSRLCLLFPRIRLSVLTGWSYSLYCEFSCEFEISFLAEGI